MIYFSQGDFEMVIVLVLLSLKPILMVVVREKVDEVAQFSAVVRDPDHNKIVIAAVVNIFNSIASKYMQSNSRTAGVLLLKSPSLSMLLAATATRSSLRKRCLHYLFRVGVG